MQEGGGGEFEILINFNILKILCCYKYNEINVCHPDVQKHVSHTRLYKSFLMNYGLCLEASGNAFSIVFYGLFQSC